MRKRGDKRVTMALRAVADSTATAEDRFKTAQRLSNFPEVELVASSGIKQHDAIGPLLGSEEFDGSLRQPLSR